MKSTLKILLVALDESDAQRNTHAESSPTMSRCTGPTHRLIAVNLPLTGLIGGVGKIADMVWVIAVSVY
jgi:hypothetical protein